MESETPFADLVLKVREGDDRAASELLSRYEPHIRRVVRIRLTDQALRRQMDSMDICQSVMGDFFVRANMGQFDLDSPEQLIALLGTMVRNKLNYHSRKQHAARRDVRRQEGGDAGEMDVAEAATTPSEFVANKEMLSEVRKRLSSDELYLVEQRANGRSWDELASELGEKVNALRMRLTRAIDRVSGELG